jgi:hypothetical protein
MTPLLPELAAFPVPGVLDGELIAFTDREPDFLALTERSRSADPSQGLRRSVVGVLPRLPPLQSRPLSPAKSRHRDDGREARAGRARGTPT